ncbi:hypothetical protein BVC71_06280 [Marivivens niveibacter]|uniref:DUF2062 domain-containing protein n=1 Tax=Marivivens niveibacter TaxID=1930667 RepID=A0A251WZ90_9RHOB|nr:DUF2062 domain-containing protein [Marivivens niveibacter]OUD09455.1 hypothetical protein BVC71_06280 [Marivivens niveibacter]
MLWPRGGWLRAYNYVKHRLRRLPDTPEKICRGIAVGVFLSFTPFFGFHIIFAWLAARAIRGNSGAAVLGTFSGNPATFGFIAFASLTTGHFMLGSRPDHDPNLSVMEKFSAAWQDLSHNFFAIFTPAKTDWRGLELFFHDVFVPYAIGGVLIGTIAAVITYYITLPVISAYQASRRKRLRNRMAQLSRSAEKHADDTKITD